ncbi:MAG TPA: response regulator, partial [Methylibium sp.]
MQQRSILIVEDEAIVAMDLRAQLQKLGYKICGTAGTASEAKSLVERLKPDLALMDIQLQGPEDGISAAQAICQRHRVPVIFLTAFSDEDTVRRAAGTAAYGYLTKPFQIKELRAGIEIALSKAAMERQLREADLWFVHTLRC